MSDFPLLDNRKIVYLDSAATTQKPQMVIDAVKEYYEEHNANIHRTLYTLGQESTALYEKSREAVAQFLNTDSKQIIFTSGTTESINFIAHSWGLFNLKKDDEILLTPLEHHANILPWQHVAKVTGAKLVYCDLNPDFTINVDDLKQKMNAKTKLLTITHASNVLGIATPLKEIIPYAKERGITVLVDGAQAVPHSKVDLQELQPDFYVFSAHKMLGPTGVGVLYMDEKHLGIEPYLFGGDMINDVWEDHAEFAKGEPRRFEAGTRNLAGVAGFGAAIAYLNDFGMEKIHSQGEELLKYAWNQLKSIGVTLYGPDPENDPQLAERAPVISFNVDGVHPHDVAQVLDEQSIAIRSGKHCAHPLMRRMDVAATNRVSFYLYNTKADVDALVTGIKKVQEVFR